MAAVAAAADSPCVSSADGPSLDAAVVSHTQLALPAGMLTAQRKYIVALAGATDSLGEAEARLGATRESLAESLRSISDRLDLSDPRQFGRLARRQATLDASPQGIYGVDPEGQCLFANRVSAGMFGYRAEELLGTNIYALLHHRWPYGSRLPPTACEILTLLRAADIAHAAEALFWGWDGRPIWVAYTVASVGVPGAPVASVVVFEDSSDRVRSAQALSISDARFEMVLDAAQTVAFQVDLRTGRTMCSHNASRALGLELGTTVMSYEDFLSRVRPHDRRRVDPQRHGCSAGRPVRDRRHQRHPETRRGAAVPPTGAGHA